MSHVLARVAAVTVGLLLAGCASSPGDDGADVRVASLRGPTTMGLVGMMDDASLTSGDNTYEFSMHGTADEIVPLLTQGQIDIALIPANLAAVLYQRTVDTEDQIAVLAINTLGVLNVVETGTAVTSLSDLEGRTVYSTGRGTTPEWVLTYLLSEVGLTPGVDVDVQYRSEATEVAALLSQDPDAIGVLPQPYVSILQANSPDVRIAIDLTQAYEFVTPGATMVTGVAVVRTSFAESNPEAVAAFLADYEASLAFANAEPEQTAPLIVAAGLVPTDDIALAAIPASHLTFIAGAEMKRLLLDYLTVLHGLDPASVGGSLPGDDFFYGD